MKFIDAGNPTGPSPLLFTPLEQTDFSRLPHAPYLKGLLRPFKGKGELDVWANQCAALQSSLITLAQRVLAQGTAYPLNLLPVVLAQQNTGAGTVFLRWRRLDRSAMGVSLWTELIEHPGTPTHWIPALFHLELQRIALNMQISLTHSIARQARECAEKMAQAETLYRRRIHPSDHTT